MTTYNTNNPVEPNGSTEPRDLYDNAQNLDIATNSITQETWLDRLNRTRKTWFGMEQVFNRLMVYLKGLGEEAISSIGWQELGDWVVNLTLNNRDQVVWYDNAWYKYIGELPHTITGDSPEADGGIWSDENPSGKWVNIGDAALRGDLASHDVGRGGSLIALLQGGTVQNAITYVTPEMFGAKADLITDDTNAIASAIAYAGASSIKGVFFGQKYKINNSANFDVLGGVTVFGAGDETGVVMNGTPTSNLHVIFNLAGKGSELQNFAIDFTTNGLGSIASVRTYGVFLQSTSSLCQVSGLRINGKITGVMGFSNGIRCTGYKNKITNNNIQYCSMGITYRGYGHEISYNYANNHFLTDGKRPWTSATPYWDGITGEGAIDCIISFNTTEENGQSGIYLGGNGSLSYGNLITGNKVLKNYNRGIDCGIFGTVSPTNNVKNLRVTENHCKDNHEAQLWLYGVSYSTVSSNISEVSEDYDHIYPEGRGGSLAGISLGESISCINNVVTSNVVKVTDTALYAFVMNGTGHIFKDNKATGKASYLWANDYARLVENNIEGYSKEFPVSVVTGSGIGISQSYGWYSINGASLDFSMSLTLSASSPSGSLSFGFLPGVAGATSKISNVNVNSYNGWSSSMNGSLRAMQDNSNKDQIIVFRDYQGSRRFDVAALALTGATIVITGSIKVLKQ